MEDNNTNNTINFTTHGLTQSQMALWTGQQFNPDTPLYNMALAFELNGSIDPDHFQNAFQALINQSDALRTVFVLEEEEPVQRILSTFPYTVEYIDWSVEPQKEDFIQNWLEKRSQRLFNLSECLYDSILIKKSSEVYIWYFNQHHLITDGWSVTVLYKKMAELYALSLTDQLDQATKLPQFRDYIDYEAKEKPGDQVSKEYWLEKLKKLAPVPQFYGDDTLVAKTNNQRVVFDLGRERSDQLRALTKEVDLRSWSEHLSLFNIFATTLFAYLHRVSGQQKLAIGTPAHNRVTPDFRSTPGVFIEVFPLLVEVREDETFGSLVQNVRNEAHLFLKHAKPGVGSAELSRGFNVVLNYINASFSDFNGLPMQSTWVHPNHADPGHHLRLQVHDFDASGSIQLHFDLNESVFSESLREEVPGHFVSLLDAFIRDRSRAIGQPDLLSATQKEAIDTKINTSDNSNDLRHQAVIKLFEQQVVTQADRPALMFGEQQMSYGELNKKANQFASFLTKRGIGQDDRIAIHLTRRPELLISILASMKVGATYIPVPANLPPGKVHEMLQDADLRLLISTSNLLEKLEKTELPLFQIEKDMAYIDSEPSENLNLEHPQQSTAYIMYTSGSTGQSKGVMISNSALSHYIQWAADKYLHEDAVVPLFTSIGFDLTVTSLFTPLVKGGQLIIYEEALDGPDLSVLDVIKENKVDFIKLTPSHLLLVQGKDLSDNRINTIVVGGENFKAALAQDIYQSFKKDIKIYNEYGPTEATVGCVVHRFDPAKDQQSSVPIGLPVPFAKAYVLDDHLNRVPVGVSGELYMAGPGLAGGYWRQVDLTAEKFIMSPFNEAEKLYRTGDLVRLNSADQLEFLGRKDQQVKIGGRRIELGEVEAALSQHPDIQTCVVDLRDRKQQTQHIENCKSCGLPSNYPGTDFDEHGVCHLCNSYESYQQKVQEYFKTPDDLKTLINSATPNPDREYDCLMLFSGGKDSTYALGQLIELGFRVLTFTLDNGYISEQAIANVRRVTKELGVDCHFGETPVMNEIFVDSLQRHCNVCDGCFKTIYTLSVQLALEKDIPFIVTGLSRGQLFETRLTEELFTGNKNSIEDIDQIILNARKDYHRVDDAVKQLLDVSIFETDEVFEKVRFVDFYRYTDVSLDEMYEYLDNRLPWKRPTDTGRSTNCLINQTGIFIHKKERGYSNYAFPYSWDVRIGHKERNASLDEINEEIDEKEVYRILNEIGYTDAERNAIEEEHLIAYYVSDRDIPEVDLNLHLSALVPEYMIPVQFIRVDEMPLTENGKIDQQALPKPDAIRPMLSIGYVEPRTDIEMLLAEIWSDVLNIERIGVHDKFLHLGGHSLTAIRLTARINETLDLDLPLNLIFIKPTIALYGEHVEKLLEQLVAEMDDA